MPVTAPKDRRFRRAHLKPGGKRAAWTGARWRVGATLAVLALTGFAAHRSLAALASLRVFQIQRIVVHGNHRLSSGEVAALLDGLRGRSIFEVDLDEWRGHVLNSPWVSEALLRRTLPTTVDVTVQERSPLGIGRLNGLLYLVDDAGTPIDEYGPNYADLDLPIIDGLSSAPGDADPDAARALLARRVLDAVRGRNMASRISQIDVTDPRNAVVLLDGDSTLVRLGDDRFAERLQSYVTLAPALRDRVDGIDYVDMRFDERVYVRPVPRAAAPPPARAPAARRKVQAAKS
jgi:cell division protein FtsQ